MLSSIHVSNRCLYSRLPASKLRWYIIYILSFSIFLAAASIFGAPEWSASSPAPLTFELQVTVGAPCDEARYRSLNILWVRTDITGKCKAAHHKQVMHFYYWWVNWLMFNLLIKMWHKWWASYIFVCTIYNCFAYHNKTPQCHSRRFQPGGEEGIGRSFLHQTGLAVCLFILFFSPHICCFLF